MFRLGFAVSTLNHSQLTYFLIREINAALEQNKTSDFDPIIFYEDLSQIRMRPACALMPISELCRYNGMVVATSLSTAEKAVNIPGSPLRIFYPYTLDWIKPQVQAYESIARVYCNPNLKIISRNKDHSVAIKNAFNVQPIGEVEDFNISKIREICLDYQKTQK